MKYRCFFLFHFKNKLNRVMQNGTLRGVMRIRGNYLFFLPTPFVFSGTEIVRKGTNFLKGVRSGMMLY